MMKNEEFRFAWALRLGLEILNGSSYCTLCKKHIDKKGIHSFSCPRQRQALTEKHDSLVKEIAILAYLGGVKAKDHHLNLFTQLDPNNMLRPDLLLPFLAENGLNLLLDFVLTDPRNFTNCVKAAHYIAWAMLERARFKKNKYQLLCHQAGYKFLPFSCEIFGSMTEDSLDLIRLLVRKAADRSHIPYSILLPYWIKRISMNIQKGNASFFMKSTVRMTGSDSLHDASVSMSTHHIRIAAE